MYYYYMWQPLQITLNALFRPSDIAFENFRMRFLELTGQLFKNKKYLCKSTMQSWELIFDSLKRFWGMDVMANQVLTFSACPDMTAHCAHLLTIVIQYSLWYLPMLVTRYLSFRLNLWADAVTRLNLLRILYTVHSTRSAEHDRFKQSISFHIVSAIKIELQAGADTREHTVLDFF